jgi:hypothetical protein
MEGAGPSPRHSHERKDFMDIEQLAVQINAARETSLRSCCLTVQSIIAQWPLKMICAESAAADYVSSLLRRLFHRSIFRR